MKRLGCCLVAIAVVISLMCLGGGCDRAGSDRPLPPIEIYFSPHGGCTEAVVDQIDRAANSILVQAYSFTSAPIAKALVDAHNRGVEVQVILDASQETEKYSSGDFLVHAGIPTLVDHQHAIAHNKVIILDGNTVVTGSFNFTKAAEEHNAENLLVIRDAAIAEQYAANWHEHALHSKPYEHKAAADPGDSRPAASKKSKAGARKGTALLP
jgi:phosphatidylserine/phosphatidylglycerophosphate/cardiolipin synthase-like enzyme